MGLETGESPKNSIACVDLNFGRGWERVNTILFCETTVLYVPARVFFQSFQTRVASTCARVCAVNVNHEERLLQPCETIATVNAGLNVGVNAVEKMVNQKNLCTKHINARVSLVSIVAKDELSANRD